MLSFVYHFGSYSIVLEGEKMVTFLLWEMLICMYRNFSFINFLQNKFFSEFNFDVLSV